MATLTEEHKRQFVRDGFLHVPGVVPSRVLIRARRAINHSLGAGIDRNDLTGLRPSKKHDGHTAREMQPDCKAEPRSRKLVRLNNQTFCAELRADPRLLRLATSPAVWNLVRALLGDGRAVRPQQCQIALRFPLPDGTPRKISDPHIDGYHTPHNGVPDDGVVRNFTLLLGVMLSDVREPFSGNFTVWPGTHHRMQRYFRDHGVNSLHGGAVGGLGLRLPKPVPVVGHTGDIVLAHYQVAHTASPNLSGDIRYMCFFRLSVRNLGSHRVASMLDIWRDWPVLRNSVASDA